MTYLNKWEFTLPLNENSKYTTSDVINVISYIINLMHVFKDVIHYVFNVKLISNEFCVMIHYRKRLDSF